MAYAYLAMIGALPIALYVLAREVDEVISQLPESARERLQRQNWD